VVYGSLSMVDGSLSMERLTGYVRGKVITRGKMIQKDKMLHIAGMLARHFDDGTQIGPCACSGLECAEPRCPVWWSLFLSLEREEINAMIRMYFDARSWCGKGP